MSVDVEIYLNNLIKFFRQNPNDLLNLVPKHKEEEFYRKLREKAFENYEKGDEISLTQDQITKICIDLDPMKSIERLFRRTPFGFYCLN